MSKSQRTCQSPSAQEIYIPPECDNICRLIIINCHITCLTATCAATAGFVVVDVKVVDDDDAVVAAIISSTLQNIFISTMRWTE
jgi:hypothetical protein